MKKIMFLLLLFSIGTLLIAQTAQTMIRIEGGSFQMGSPSGGDTDERPVRTVTVSTFQMSKYPVTQKEWFDIMGTTIEQQRDIASSELPLRGTGDNHPMYYISWHEAIEYCNRLSLREGLKPVYRISRSYVTFNRKANGYRLPTEAEWEFAAKSGNMDSIVFEYSGSNRVDEVAWFSGNSNSNTKLVGTKAPNSLGLHDMSGNVWEWCWDWYGIYPNSTQRNPVGASSGSLRVIRGGSWANSAENQRSAYRSYHFPSYRNGHVGFRVVRSGD
jgi:formylglycine-generating enzyme required for sulfatase activity